MCFGKKVLCTRAAKKGQRISDYGRQLRKQKIREFIISENQFRNIYKKANQKKVLLVIYFQLLESRLDPLLYRAELVLRVESRQIIRHNGIKVNDKNVNIPSFTVSSGDKISLADKLKNNLE